MSGYIPDRAPEFLPFASNFSAQLQTFGASFGFSATEISDFNDNVQGSNAAYSDHLDADNMARSKTAAWKGSHDTTESEIRAAGRRLQAHPAMTDEIRELFGLPVRDAVPTGLDEGMVGSIAPPLLLLDWSQRGRLRIHFGVNPGNERENAMPKGIRDARIWIATGGIPTNQASWVFLGDSHDSPYEYVMTITTATTVGVRAAWVDTKNNVGPYSDPAVGTVTV